MRNTKFECEKSDTYIPISEKYVLTVEEVAVYFHIGENKLRNIIHDDMTADYILWNGSRALIKRKLFEKYIDEAGSI